MQKMVANGAVLAALLACGGLTLAQPQADEKKPSAKPIKKPAKPSVDSLLAEALKNNPDIQVAEAKLRQADAQLNRTRLQVMQKVVAYHHSLESQKAQVAYAQAQFDRMNELVKRGVVTEQMLGTASAALLAAKAKLAEIEAELPYLLGKQPQKEMSQVQAEERLASAQRRLEYLHYFARLREAQALMQAERLFDIQAADLASPRGTAGDKLRKALDTPIMLRIKDVPLGEVLAMLEDRVPNITFRILGDKSRDIRAKTIELRFKQAIPLGAVLQAIQDSVPQLRFAVREYGLLVTWSDQLPPDAVLVQEFWKHGADKKTDGAGDPTSSNIKKNPPKSEVNGKITQISQDHSVVAIDIGSDAGLVKGHTLEVFRLQPRPIYLGTLLIINVQKNRAVGKMVNAKMQAKILPGDRVTSQVMQR